MQKIYLSILMVYFQIALSPLLANPSPTYPFTALDSHHQLHGNLDSLLNDFTVFPPEEEAERRLLERSMLILDYVSFGGQHCQSYLDALQRKVLPVVKNINLTMSDEDRNGYRGLFVNMIIQRSSIASCVESSPVIPVSPVVTPFFGPSLPGGNSSYAILDPTLLMYANGLNTSQSILIQTDAEVAEAIKDLDTLLGTLDFLEFQNEAEIIEFIEMQGFGEEFETLSEQYSPSNFDKLLLDLEYKDRQLLKANPLFYFQQKVDPSILKNDPVLQGRIEQMTDKNLRHLLDSQNRINVELLQLDE